MDTEERDLKAQLEKLKQEQEVLAAERLRLQQVTSLMEHEVRRRQLAQQQMLGMAPTADFDGDTGPFR